MVTQTQTHTHTHIYIYIYIYIYMKHNCEGHHKFTLGRIVHGGICSMISVIALKFDHAFQCAKQYR
jgi:hypothetical protein